MIVIVSASELAEALDVTRQGARDLLLRRCIAHIQGGTFVLVVSASEALCKEIIVQSEWRWAKHEDMGLGNNKQPTRKAAFPEDQEGGD